jgi:hypothetical protein
MTKQPQAAIGFRVHSGWATLMAVTGSFARPTLDPPVILLRRRIEIADETDDGPFQPFHRAAEMEIGAARQFLEECTKTTRKLARQALQRAIDELKEHTLAGCAILEGSGRKTANLEATLHSHPAIHTAEGEFFRDAMRHACVACGLRCDGIKEKDVQVASAAAFGNTDRRLAELGKLLGPPWQQDQKHAALAGWLVLAGRI